MLEVLRSPRDATERMWFPLTVGSFERGACGLGAELAALLPLVWMLRTRTAIYDGIPRRPFVDRTIL